MVCLTLEGPSLTFLRAPSYPDFNTEPELLLRDPRRALHRARPAVVFRSEQRQRQLVSPLCPGALYRGWLSDLPGECLGNECMSLRKRIGESGTVSSRSLPPAQGSGSTSHGTPAAACSYPPHWTAPKPFRAHAFFSLSLLQGWGTFTG